MTKTIEQIRSWLSDPAKWEGITVMYLCDARGRCYNDGMNYDEAKGIELEQIPARATEIRLINPSMIQYWRLLIR